jgi:nitrogen fixation-related uncharacterized protein
VIDEDADALRVLLDADDERPEPAHQERGHQITPAQ